MEKINDKDVLKLFLVTSFGALLFITALDKLGVFKQQMPTRTLEMAIKEAEGRIHKEVLPNCEHATDIDYWKARALDCLCEGRDGLILKKDVDFCTASTGRAIRKSCHG